MALLSSSFLLSSTLTRTKGVGRPQSLPCGLCSPIQWSCGRSDGDEGIGCIVLAGIAAVFCSFWGDHNPPQGGGGAVFRVVSCVVLCCVVCLVLCVVLARTIRELGLRNNVPKCVIIAALCCMSAKACCIRIAEQAEGTQHPLVVRSHNSAQHTTTLCVLGCGLVWWRGVAWWGVAWRSAAWWDEVPKVLLPNGKGWDGLAHG